MCICMYMCEQVYVCGYMYMYMYLCTCVNMHICVYITMYTSLYLCTYTSYTSCRLPQARCAPSQRAQEAEHLHQEAPAAASQAEQHRRTSSLCGLCRSQRTQSHQHCLLLQQEGVLWCGVVWCVVVCGVLCVVCCGVVCCVVCVTHPYYLSPSIFMCVC